jgi:glycosyltransferase involved in cell wall biosynthesis
MRAIIVSRHAASPALRGKLRALGGLGCTIAAAVPDRIAAAPGNPPHRIGFGEDAGVRIVPIPVRGGLDQPDSLRWSRRALRRLIRDFRPDIVQVEETPGSPAAAAAVGIARRLDVPAVLLATESVRGTPDFFERYRRRRALGVAAGVLGINRIALGLAASRRNDLPRAVVPQHGVLPPASLRRVPHDDFAIGFVGRLLPERGLDLLFRAALRLTGRWSLTVAGTGPAQEELETLAERLGIAARIRWLGGLPRRELDELWPTLDCVALPARTTQRWVEAVGTSLLDAMGYGIPVVGSSSGAIPEIIGEAGLVVPEDDPAALGDALERVAGEPALRDRLGAEGRRRVVEHYAEAAVARDTLAFWRQIRGPTTPS